MVNCINYDCTSDLGTYLQNHCSEELLGGISAAVYLECNHQLTDPSSGTQIAAEIVAGRAKLVKGIKVGITKPSPVQVDSNVSCGVEKVVVTYDRQGTLIDGNVNSTNVSFYNSLFGGHTLGGIIFYLCGTEESYNGAKVLWIDDAVNFTGGLIIPNANNAFQTFEGDFFWRKKNGPQMYPGPVGIF